MSYDRPEIAYPKNYVDIDVAKHVMSWGGEHKRWAHRQLQRMNSQNITIFWWRGSAREVMWTMFGELRLGDDLYYWYWRGQKYELPQLLRELPASLEPYVVTRTRWLIAYLIDEQQYRRSDHDKAWIQEQVDRLQRQLDELGLASTEYEIAVDDDPIPPTPESLGDE